MQVTKTFALVAATIVGIATAQTGQSPTKPGPGGNSAPTVTVKNGSYVGLYLSSYNQDAFLGIRYAQPPVGDLRYRNPQPINATWSTPKNATEYAPQCYGKGPQGGNPSEDCLTLNIVRPRTASNTSKLPVAVWIHGGAYIGDSARNPNFNLTFMVDQSVQMKKPIVAVSLDYRLHAWGFLWGSAVKAAGVGNLGLKDQRLALHWVQENIAAFGGDPTKVTIFGESAGGGSVGNQILAFGGRDDKLFRAAIIESMDVISNGYVTAEEYDPFYNKFVEAANCSSSKDTLDCLRHVPAETLNSIYNGPVGLTVRSFPVIDGDFLQETGKAQLIKGKFVKVPLLQGNNHDEGTMFTVKGINTEDEFLAYLRGELRLGFVPVHWTAEQALILSKLYPDIPAIGIPATLHERPAVNSTLGAQYKRVTAYMGDSIMHAGRRYMAETWTRNNISTYHYLFNVDINGFGPDMGVAHTAEIPFVFNNLNGLGYLSNPFEGKPESYKCLSKLMSRMWISFFNDLTPNHSGETKIQWPVYSNDDANIVFFDVNATSNLLYVAPDTYRAEGIAYLQSLYD